jgi:hypothetical protein
MNKFTADIEITAYLLNVITSLLNPTFFKKKLCKFTSCLVRV